jgi:hypothetical protein
VESKPTAAGCGCLGGPSGPVAAMPIGGPPGVGRRQWGGAAGRSDWKKRSKSDEIVEFAGEMADSSGPAAGQAFAMRLGRAGVLAGVMKR